MRPLSKNEKRIVSKIAKDSQYFSDLFDSAFLANLVIEIQQDAMLNEYKVRYLFHRSVQRDEQWFKRNLSDATDQIVQTVNLLTYLMDEAYVYSYHPAHGIAVRGHIGLKETINKYRDKPEEFTSSQHPDTDTRDIILQFTNRLFVGTEALKEYVTYGYRTSEEIRHRQNLILAWVAIIISTILGLAGIYLSSIDSFKSLLCP